MKKCLALLLALLFCGGAAHAFGNGSFFNGSLSGGGFLNDSFLNDSLPGGSYGGFLSDSYLGTPGYGSGAFLNDSYTQAKPQKNVLVNGRPWLPDPEGVLGAAAEGADGKYIYRSALTEDDLHWAFLAYADCLEAYGFTHQAYSHESALYFMRFTHEAGEADLAAYGDGALLRFELSLSGGLGFEPGSYPAEMGKCIACTGSGDCEYCLSGRVNYGNGYEDCDICDGSGDCNICRGSGKF